MSSSTIPVSKPAAPATVKFSGKILDFNLGGTPREYIMGAMRYGNWRKFVAPEVFDSSTGTGEQRGIIESHSKKIKAAMSSPNVKYAPTTFTVGTRDKHRMAIEVDDGVATLEVSKDDKLPLLDGGNRSYALELLRNESRALMKLVDEIYIPYILYLDGNTQEDFIVLQAGRPVSRDHMLSVRIATGLIDKKHAPYFTIAKDVANILHTEQDSFCHNLIQSDSNGTKLPISLNSVCTKSGSDLAFSLYGGAKIAVSYKKDAEWLSNCILTAFRSIKQDDEASELLKRGNILSPVPEGSKAGTSLIIGLGNMLAARLMLKEINEPEDSDLELLLDCAVEHLRIPTRGSTSAENKRKLFNKFVVDFFSDLVSDGETVEAGDIPIKKVGAHEGVPVVLVKLLTPSTFDVSKLPSLTKRGRKPKTVPVVETQVETNVVVEDDVDVDVNDEVVSREDPIDAAAFAEMDSAKPVFEVEEDSAPWDDEELV